MPFWKIFTKRTTSHSETAETTLRYSFGKAKTRASNAGATASDEKPDAAQKALDAGLEIVEEKPDRAVSGKGGFDPYNSGAFDRRGNWDKTKLK